MNYSDSYSYNTTANANRTSSSNYSFTIVVISLRALIMVAGIIGNTLVIITLLQHKGMRTVTNLLLLNLSVSDLLIISVCMSFTMVVDILQNFIFGTAGCMIIRFLQGVTIAANAFTLCAIALERYFAIVLPFWSRGFQTSRHAQKMIACIWVLAAVLMIPFGAYHEARPALANSSTARCEVHARDKLEWKLYFFVMLALLIVIPAIFLLLAYGMILIVLSRRLRLHKAADRQEQAQTQTQTQTQNAGGERSICNGLLAIGKPLYHMSFGAKSASASARTLQDGAANGNCIAQSTHKSIAMLLLIVALFFVCCVPNYAQQTWYMLNAEQARRYLRAYSGYILLLQNLNVCVNPVCYCFMSRSFRHHFLEVFGCRRRKGSNPHSYATSVGHQVEYRRRNRVSYKYKYKAASEALSDCTQPFTAQNCHEIQDDDD